MGICNNEERKERKRDGKPKWREREVDVTKLIKHLAVPSRSNLFRMNFWVITAIM